MDAEIKKACMRCKPIRNTSRARDLTDNIVSDMTGATTAGILSVPNLVGTTRNGARVSYRMDCGIK